MPRGPMSVRRCGGEGGRGPDACFRAILHSRQSVPRRPTGDRIPHPLNGPSSLVAGKKAGNFSDSAVCENLSRKHLRSQYLAREFPTQTSRELFRARRELFPGLALEQGIWREIDSCAPKYQTAATCTHACRATRLIFRGSTERNRRGRPLRGRLPLSRRAPADGRGEASQNLGGRGGVERWRRRRATE